MRACENPFRTDRVLSLKYRFLNNDNWESLLDRLHSLRYRAAIVGPEGVGKTTLHEELAERLESQGRTIRWLRLNRENRQSAPKLIDGAFIEATPSDMLFVDGAEQLSAMRWQLLKRRAASLAGLVINVHTPGRLPTLIECETTAELLKDVASELMTDCPSKETLERLFDQHDGNVRQCLRALYDICAMSDDAAGD